MSTRFHRSHWRRVAALASIIAVTSLVLFAQGPPPPPAPATQTPDATAPPAGTAAQTGPRAVAGAAAAAQDDLTGIDLTKQPPVLPKTPEEELKQFILQPGYRLELVLSDPIIQEPTAIAFDGNGRMFVARGSRLHAGRRHDRRSSIRSAASRCTSTPNNDGVYDKHTVFVDHLVFPRFVTPFGPNTILTKESNAQEVWKYTDTNGDGVADKKELFDTGYGRLGNIEQQESFLTWTLDNWLYSTYNAFRARWTPHGVVKEPTGSNGARVGRHAGQRRQDVVPERRAAACRSYWQFPIVYGNFTRRRDELEPDFRIPWGAPVRVADMQGGLSITRMPDGSLEAASPAAPAATSPRPSAAEGSVGRVPLRRAGRRASSAACTPENKEGLTYLHNVYPKQRVHQVARSVLPPGRSDDGAGRHRLHHRHVPRHHPGRRTSPGPAPTCARASSSTTSTRSFTRAASGGWSTTASSRIDRTRCARDRDRAADEQRDAGAARDASRPSERLVARHRAAAARAQAGQVGRAGAADRSLKTSTNLLARFHALWTLEGLGALEAGARRAS